MARLKSKSTWLAGTFKLYSSGQRTSFGFSSETQGCPVVMALLRAQSCLSRMPLSATLEQFSLRPHWHRLEQFATVSVGTRQEWPTNGQQSSTDRYNLNFGSPNEMRLRIAYLLGPDGWTHCNASSALDGLPAYRYRRGLNCVIG